MGPPEHIGEETYPAAITQSYDDWIARVFDTFTAQYEMI